MSAPIYPVICQIAVSPETFEDAKNDIRSLFDAYPSIRMVIIIDIREVPSYKSPTPESEARKTLRSGECLDYVCFAKQSSYHGSGSILRFSTNPLPSVAGGHTWCLIKEVPYHLWIKARASLCIMCEYTTSTKQGLSSTPTSTRPHLAMSAGVMCNPCFSKVSRDYQ